MFLDILGQILVWTKPNHWKDKIVLHNIALFGLFDPIPFIKDIRIIENIQN